MALLICLFVLIMHLPDTDDAQSVLHSAKVLWCKWRIEKLPSRCKLKTVRWYCWSYWTLLLFQRHTDKNEIAIYDGFFVGRTEGSQIRILSTIAYIFHVHCGCNFDQGSKFCCIFELERLCDEKLVSVKFAIAKWLI